MADEAAASGTPAWLSAIGSGLATAGRFGANTLALVAGSPVLPFPMQGGGASDPMDPRTWQHPERYAIARQVVPDTLPPEEQQARMTRLYHTPFKLWNDIFHEYKTEDRQNAETMQSQVYRDIYAQGGPAALRAFNMPLPPQVLAAQDAPLSAEAQARGETAPSLPDRVRQDIMPPIPPEELVKRFKANTQLSVYASGNVDDIRAIAGLPPTVAYEVGRQRALREAQNQEPHLPVFGGGGAPTATTPRPVAPGMKPGGNQGVQTPQGRYYDLGNGQYADERGTIVDAIPTGATAVPATVEPADAAAPTTAPAPMAGRAIEDRFPPIQILPGESPETFEQRKKAREADIQLALSGDKAAQALATKRQLERDNLLNQVREDQAYMDTVFSQLDPLISDKSLPLRENFPSSIGGTVRDLFYQGRQMTHTRNAYPEQAELMRVANGVLGQISRRFSGEKGVLTDKDVEVRARPLVPDERDSQETARRKVAQLKAFGAELAARRLDPNWQPPPGENRIGDDGKPVAGTTSDPAGATPTAAPARSYSRAELEAEARKRGLLR